MNKFDTKAESLIFIERQKEFLKNVVNTDCCWGSKRDGDDKKYIVIENI